MTPSESRMGEAREALAMAISRGSETDPSEWDDCLAMADHLIASGVHFVPGMAWADMLSGVAKDAAAQLSDSKWKPTRYQYEGLCNCIREAANDLARTHPPAGEGGEALAQAVRLSAARFRDYEQQHRAKGTLDADAKAETNRQMAVMCEAAIQADTGEGGKGLRTTLAAVVEQVCRDHLVGKGKSEAIGDEVAHAIYPLNQCLSTQPLRLGEGS